MNINKIKRAAEIAKAKTTDKRWVAAINAAVKGVESLGWIYTYETHGLLITTESGNTYHANGSCQCKAYAVNTPCKHRALARLVEIADSLKDETAPAVSRAELITVIKSTFAAKFPTANLTDTICASFGPYSIHHLGAANLNAFLAAIAA